VAEAVELELPMVRTLDMLRQAHAIGLRWVYCCGLGEPLEDQRFRQIIEVCSQAGTQVSLFTNALEIDESIATWLYKNGVNLIVKLDSLNEEHFDRILGRRGAAREAYRAIECLLSAGYGRNCGDGLTDLAFSIVPTSITLHDIAEVIGYAVQVHAFPSVGELEQAGRVIEKHDYSTLALSQEDIDDLRNEIESLLWKGYTRPICPSIVTGLHVDNQGNCIVDRPTGLNCKWFMLREPDTHILGNVGEVSLKELLQLVCAYRRECFRKNEFYIANCEKTHYVFGGCGGSPREIIKIARSHLK
jgi:MoaA/NifB/PqqE/SkfB family radical SAM enzyme